MNLNKILDSINSSLKKRNYHDIKVSDKLLNVPIREIKIDSLLMLSIVTDLEEIFNVQLSDEQLLSIQTVNDLVKFFS